MAEGQSLTQFPHAVRCGATATVAPAASAASTTSATSAVAATNEDCYAKSGMLFHYRLLGTRVWSSPPETRVGEEDYQTNAFSSLFSLLCPWE